LTPTLYVNGSDNGLLDKSRHLHLNVKEEASSLDAVNRSSFMRLDDISQDVAQLVKIKETKLIMIMLNIC